MKKRNTGVIQRIKGKRDWVKNAIIIFLAVLLVLTFFSNTIMNYSLPEVAAQYPQSTTITTKVRGSGTVEAAQSYNVTVEETRTVASVSVKAGDTVAAGDTLLTLDETESEELTAARTSYNALKLEYDKMLVDKGDQSHVAETTLQQARDAVTQAESDLAKARSYESSLSYYQSQVASAQSTVTARTQAKNEADTQLALLQSQKEAMAETDTYYMGLVDKVDEAQTRVTDLQSQIAEVEARMDAAEGEELASLQTELSSLQTELNTAQTELNTATKTMEQYTIGINQKIADANTAVINADAAVASAQTALEQANNALSQFQSENTSVTSVDAAESALQAAKEALATAEATAADNEAQETYESEITEKEVEAKAQEVADALETVEALEAKTAASKIVSRYAGVVRSVNVAAGDTTSAETPLMVVELTEKGYTLTATVTKDQARLLQEGLTADITNLWNADVTMTLASITVDKNDASGSRTLTFAVEGEDVTVGEQLSFSIGNKNASYDVVIPSSAVHTDSDGSFVYTVTVKSSPLGNRYTVKRTTVEVIASDDTNSAVTGGLSTADFVITTSTVPLEVGDQVRIAE